MMEYSLVVKANTFTTLGCQTMMNGWSTKLLAIDSMAGPSNLTFNWTTGDHTWEPYSHVKDLEALDHYYALMGVTHWQQLGRRNNDPEGDPLVDPPVANPRRTMTMRKRGRN
jgi:hypothetical protein